MHSITRQRRQRRPRRARSSCGGRSGRGSATGAADVECGSLCCDGRVCSCTNRHSEWRKGRRPQGQGTDHLQAAARPAWWLSARRPAPWSRLLEVARLAEGRRSRAGGIPDGARLVRERQLTALNRAPRESSVCAPTCRTAGLVLERRRGVVLERHHVALRRLTSSAWLDWRSTSSQSWACTQTSRPRY